MAEASDNDPAKLCEGHVLDELFAAASDAVDDDPVDDILEVGEPGNWSARNG